MFLKKIYLNSIMRKYLFINYYDEKNKDRKNEYLFCVQKNLNLNFIDKIFIYINKKINRKDLLNLKNSEKLYFIHTEDRFDFSDVILYCKKKLKEECIIIIVNLDIFLEDSPEWENIFEDFFAVGTKEKALVCSRNNYMVEKLPIETKYFEKLSWDRGDFCDAWVFKFPFKENFLDENFKFSVGNAPGCDGLMMGLMSKYYKTFSWGKKYKILHYDICRKTKINSSKFNFYISSKISGKKVSFILNDRADITPTARMNEWYRIPNNQNWDEILKENRNPVIYKSRLNSKSKLRNKISLIYHLILFRLSQFIYKINNLIK